VYVKALYTCSDGAVLTSSARCNGYVECSDAADENACSKFFISFHRLPHTHTHTHTHTYTHTHSRFMVQLAPHTNRCSSVNINNNRNAACLTGV